MAFASSEPPINEPKNVNARTSMTPLVMVFICDKKLNERTASSTLLGTAPASGSSTAGVPASTSTKPTKKVNTKAMT